MSSSQHEEDVPARDPRLRGVDPLRQQQLEILAAQILDQPGVGADDGLGEVAFGRLQLERDDYRRRL